MIPGKKNVHKIACILCCLFLFPGISQAQKNPGKSGISDPKATAKTKVVFQNLQYVSGKWMLFGHQDDLAYGVHWKGEQGRSDVREVCGAYPSVFGWDVGELVDGAEFNIDSVPFQDMRSFMQFAYKQGSINTISWHLDNLGTGGDSWDTTSVVADLLPGGKYHGRLINQLDDLANYLNTLKTQGLFKTKIPIIFRPWHENTGHWFWWGSASCTPEEYVTLWRFTVDYLRTKKRINHLLYAFSPSGNYSSADEYLKTYPGDAYVDILGLDYYYHAANKNSAKAELSQKLAIISRLATDKGKVSALTETGYETIPDSTWWTKTLLDHLTTDAEAAKIAYVLVWRNAFHKSRPNHYYAPFPGQVSSEDFKRFARHDRVALNDKLPNFYRNIRRKPARETQAPAENAAPTP